MVPAPNYSRPSVLRAAMQFLNMEAIAEATVQREPYPYLVAHGVLAPKTMPIINNDFPNIKKAGFFPLSEMSRSGAFDLLLKDLENPGLADILSAKFGIDLQDKPRLITVRKWSAAKDGRIHNDGVAKVVNSLIYLNDSWPEGEDGGRFRVMRSDKSFDDMAAEVAPSYGTFLAFVRTDNSWHGHKPFVGERRVIQTTWLRSWEDYERKEKRGRFSFLLKRKASGAY